MSSSLYFIHDITCLQAFAALRDAWPLRIELAAAPDSPAAVAAVAARLGLTDPQLALLPPDALKPLSVSKSRAIPDLVFLNAPSTSSSGAAAGGGGGGAAAGGVAFGSGLGMAPAAGSGVAAAAGLQHLKLSFLPPPGSAPGSAGPAAGPLVELLCGVLKGNSSLTALTLRGRQHGL